MISNSTADRREQPRQQVDNEAAYIDLNDGRGPISCRLWDISATGACILIPPNMVLPHCFKVYVNGTWQVAGEVWRREWHAGIHFVR